MSTADDKYKDLIMDIYNNGSWDTDSKVRTVYSDDSPAYTKSIFGKQVVFEEGEIPILTTKYVGWKTAFKEMRLFWILQSVKKDDFEKENVKVWDEWFLHDNTLGKSYAYQFESRPNKELINVDRKIKVNPGKLSNITVNSKLPINYNNKDHLIGKIKHSDSGSECLILDVFKTGTHYENSKSALIQFTNTNNSIILQYDDVLNGNFRDRFERTVYGVGYLGNTYTIPNISKTLNRKLIDIWYKIISRCYNTNDKRYVDYGGKGIFVDESWHSLEQFLKDIQYIPQWQFKINDESYKLDKDYYGSNCYSKDTCVWLSNSDNILYSGSKCKSFEVYKHNEYIGNYISTIECAKSLNLDNSDISKALKFNEKVKGYSFVYTNNDTLIRYKLSKNQVFELLYNIKNNPTSRRLMTSFWNFKDVEYKALQECAMQTTLNVRDGKLDLLLYSRSVDIALGLPYNWIQYWFLLQILAKCSNLKPGKFIHQMGNVHYYDRHEELLLTQINGNSYDSPEFKISNNEEFLSYDLSDINIINYLNGGKFNYEIAI